MNTGFIETLESHVSILYTEINVIAFIIMLYVLIRIYFSPVNIISKTIFMNIIVSSMITILTDIIWKWISVGWISANLNFCYLDNTLYFIFLNITYYSLFIYFGKNIEYFNDLQTKHRTLRVLPFIINILFHISNNCHHLIYRVEVVDGDPVYIRSILFPISTIIPYGSAAVIGILLIKKTIQKRRENRLFNDYNRIIRFATVTSISALINMLESVFPIYSIALAFEVTIYYVSELEFIVSIDPLTKISNKRQFLYTMQRNTDMVRNGYKDNELYLVMIDANYFKEINDNYGHAEGDLALIRISQALKYMCADFKNYRITISRFGGDEFAIITFVENKEVVEDIITTTEKYLKELTEKDKAPYKISLSYGYYKYDDYMSIKDFIDLADNSLYEKKKKYHAQHETLSRK